MGDNADTWRGLWMCLLATWFASIGNIISARNQHNGIPVVQTNAWGMAYGALIMAVFALASGVPFNYDTSFSYSLSLIYLAVFGSILAFGAYLTLVGRIGADKAAYAAVLFPVCVGNIDRVRRLSVDVAGAVRVCAGATRQLHRADAGRQTGRIIAPQRVPGLRYATRGRRAGWTRSAPVPTPISIDRAAPN